jgi:hypothetical protein
MLPQHQAPPALREFMAEHQYIDRAANQGGVYFYHGTNCYRRWEIARCGAIEPGRSGYSFYCSSPEEAFTYARAACLRDIGPHNLNSLVSEPVVLKVRFNERSWMQADFVQPVTRPETRTSLSVAVLGPIPMVHIEEVLHCNHGRRDGQSIRTFDDRCLREGIRRLRRKTAKFRLDAWLLVKFGHWTRSAAVWLRGGKGTTELTTADQLRRLSHANAHR